MAEAKLAGKCALVTGAGRRIGRELALALGDEGVNLVLHHRRSRKEATALCGILQARGIKAWTAAADLGRPGECEGLIDRARNLAGRLDILVNNASLFVADTPADMMASGLWHLLQINAWAPFILSRAFVRGSRRGKIVNLLDTRISGMDRGHASYWLSKKLLAELTRLAAVEFAPRFSVNAVAPGLILPPAGKDEEYLRRLARKVPLQRHGDAADIAAAVVFLLKSEFITGQVVYVDGGRHLLEAEHG